MLILLFFLMIVVYFLMIYRGYREGLPRTKLEEGQRAIVERPAWITDELEASVAKMSGTEYDEWFQNLDGFYRTEWRQYRNIDSGIGGYLDREGCDPKSKSYDPARCEKNDGWELSDANQWDIETYTRNCRKWAAYYRKKGRKLPEWLEFYCK